MRFRLRTLLILLAVGPPFLAAVWFDWGHVVLAGVYFLALFLVLPAASYLWRNSA